MKAIHLHSRILSLAAAFLIAASTPALALDTAGLPAPADRLGFWSPGEQEANYRTMERIFPTTVIKAGSAIRPLPVAKAPVEISFVHEHRPYTVDDFMAANRVSGLLILSGGKIVLERYGLGRKPDERWTSFSIAKSVTSTLVGAAIRDGKIKSVNDPLTRYVPELKGGVYEDVTLENALTMRSGVHWTEDYNDPKSDFSRYATHMGTDFYKLMSAQKRDAAIGEKHYYSTAESNLIGAAVIGATGKTLSEYFSEKIWKPFGMEADGVWMSSPDGLETGGICFSATLRDYGRFGLFMLEDGIIDGKPVLPDGWVKTATAPHTPSGFGDLSYGYQWWVDPNGAYRGLGIMGQALFIDPKRQLVIVIQSAWLRAGGPERYGLQWAFLKAATEAVDAAKTAQAQR